MKNITFETFLKIEKEYHPSPASNYLPEWYKRTPSYLQDKKIPNGAGETTGTIKKCIPVFDAITAGYIITLPADVFVSQREGLPYYEWSNFNLVEFHIPEQAILHPKHSGFPYPKWINPWSIKTPVGYSTLFTQPLHRDLPFTILTGIVDTDSYTAPVNFPFVLNDPLFEGLIPAGTPIVQIIPIKRDSWKMEFGKNNFENVISKLKTKMFDKYKILFWNKKEYK
jgi:hypothetical protein